VAASDLAGPWPRTEDELIIVQRRLAALAPDLWRPTRLPYTICACFVCFPKGFVGPGGLGDHAWAAAVVMTGGRLDAHAVREGTSQAAYRSGFLALREGPVLEEAIRALSLPFEVLLVDASGRDHPRRAGLALHLGARLGVPTIGVTDRPLVAQGEWPLDQQGAISPVRVHGEIVGYWVRTVQGARPLVVHAAWRTDAETAVRVVLDALAGRRTPEPLRLARQSARSARAQQG
jgi:deoxyribonuclease V